MNSPQRVELLDGPRSVPAEHLEFARNFLAVCPFRFAKSVPSNPHEYCLRSWVPEDRQDDYDRFMALVVQHGYRGRFLRQTYVYLDVDDWRYWESPELFGSGTIINRARNECCQLGAATGGKHHAKDCPRHPANEEEADDGLQARA